MTPPAVCLLLSAFYILAGDEMTKPLPSAVLFCCDHNAVRSPMAEGLMKKFYGTDVYVQSAGVLADKDIDGFSIAVCQELGIELARHQSRSFAEVEAVGDDLSSFDLIVAFTPTSRDRVMDLTRDDALTVVYWPIMDPTATGETRAAKLDAYRACRDQITGFMKQRFD